MWTLNKMQELVISGNPLKSLSPDIHKLTELRIIKASQCQLGAVPLSVGDLQSLQQLELGGNLLQDFLPRVPKEAIRLTALSSLDLGHNRLGQVPSALKHLPALTTLVLAYNQIVDIRKLCRPEFARLFVLDISNNKVAQVPNSLAFYLTSIQNLNLANNDIGKMPHNIGLLPQLKTIQASVLN